ncbi:MAG: hypothetical protein A2086_13710 [Spirochaetes bacterium GWD1_27_9]|nr:MAG: hypothetical protein A2Z98_07910 [Spirochaetes bacterium GWB1_27_13]OHD26325.1 MAG: hypothetical protein A2Y34_09065 [Spirochaetes bacterium GWC1_27_15]OHD38768.1 MAG: hypothetical protein A2086_13710 [Spirochaetes bacterium GWD1_27_9]
MNSIKTVVGGTIGTNCYIIEDNNEVVLIDFVPEVEGEIIQRKLKVSKVLLTHIHFDHFELLCNFQKKFDFELYLSKFAYENINNKEYNLLYFIEDSSEIDNINLKNAKVVKENDIIKLNNTEILVLETPGHSQDSLSYIIKEKQLVFSGDLLFYQSIGRTDFVGSDYKTLIKSVERLFSATNDSYTVYPGHGPETNIGFEKKSNPFL